MSIDPNNPNANATLTFDDEFNSLNIGNGRNGTWDTNYWYNVTGDPNAVNSLQGNGEQEWYIDGSNPAQTANGTIAPWTVNNGVLSIKASPTPSSIASAVKNYPYISGMLETHGSFSQQYGLFEARMQLPAGQGFWPAFWLMPENGAWPPELDIMENLGNDTSSYYTTVHSNTLTNTYESTKVAANNTTGYHTYAVDWEADYTTFYEDGQQVYKVATPSDMKSPMYMILNLAVGGGWPGNADSTTNFNHTMNVDWVKVYQGNDNLAAGLTPQGSAAYYGVSGSGSTGSGSTGSGSTGSGSTGSGSTGTGSTGGSTAGFVASHDYAANGHSQVLIENNNGAIVTGGVGANGQLTYTQVSAVGSEWKVGGSADFLGQGHDQYLMENSNGALVLGSVSGSQTTYSQIGAVGHEWTLDGTGSYLGAGSSNFLMENSNGAVVVGSVGSNGQATYSQVGAIGSEWKIAGSGDFLGQGHDQFLMENSSGAVVVGSVDANGHAAYAQVGSIGSEWSIQGTGDFLGDGKSQFLMENTSGAVVVGEVGANGQTTYTQVASIGSDWKFVGSGDFQGLGHDQFMVENSAGTVDVGNVVNGQAQMTQVGALGSEWHFHM